MSNYVKTTNFATKDSLTSGDPAKKIKGTEFNTEFDNIAAAIATKADLASPTFTGTPTAPTAASGTNTTQVATTAFVQTAMAAAGAGTVTSVGVSSSDLTVTGSPVTSSGTIGLALNTVPTSKGGTGQTTYSNGQLLIGNASGGLTKSTLTAGSGVTITNGDGSITIAATGTSGVSTFSGGTTGLTPASATSGAITLGGTLAVANGGTGATTATNARTNLGLGTIATQNSSSVSITGGSISGITDLAIADGGTGASTASQARTNLGLGSLATLNTATIATGGTGVTAQPTFAAYANTSQLGISANTPTKVACNVKLWDNNTNYSTTNARFTPTVAGYYQVNGTLRFTPGSGTTGITGVSVGIYKNGQEYRRGDEVITQESVFVQPSISCIVYMNGSTDYIEMWAGFSPYGTLGTNPGFIYDSVTLTSNWSAAFLMNA